ncbi:hypothetical protein L798_04969 [Zootermopsis nevadensis]|uniref:Uncharacterized protein n=1 Tax=Zootermopsis nevadensis TaxID=136037 RepID=A0A067RC45_ZOONE|nr:hypothetical protein L798_04969 [Zootermopsis nevadensis]
MFTQSMLDDSLEEESHIWQPGTFSGSLPSVSAEGTPLSYPDISAR